VSNQLRNQGYKKRWREALERQLDHDRVVQATLLAIYLPRRCLAAFARRPAARLGRRCFRGLPVLVCDVSRRTYLLRRRPGCMLSQLHSPPRLYPCLRFTVSVVVGAQDSRPSGLLIFSRKNFAFSASFRFGEIALASPSRLSEATDCLNAGRNTQELLPQGLALERKS